MSRRWLFIAVPLALVVSVVGAANATPLFSAALGIGTHGFLVASVVHGHDAHWSWVATPPTDAPTVTAVSYFVDTGAHGGSAALTAGQISDIHAAAAIWNTSGANVSITLAASDATADIHVHMDTTSGCGSALGCAEFAYFVAHDALTYGDAHPQHEMASNKFFNLVQEMTMHDDSTFAGSWYSGAAGGIAGSEYDFLTVAIQEFGHHLGLEHNDAAAGHGEAAVSPMNGVLSSGIARRTLQPSDIAAVNHLYATAAIPEPSTALLVCMGLVAMGATRRIRA